MVPNGIWQLQLSFSIQLYFLIFYLSCMAHHIKYQSLSSDRKSCRRLKFSKKKDMGCATGEGVYWHSGKQTDLNAGSASEWKSLGWIVRLPTNRNIFFKSFVWKIATSKRNYVCKLWITISFLWFLCWNIIYNFGVYLFISLFYQATVGSVPAKDMQTPPPSVF